MNIKYITDEDLEYVHQDLLDIHWTDGLYIEERITSLKEYYQVILVEAYRSSITTSINVVKLLTQEINLIESFLDGNDVNLNELIVVYFDYRGVKFIEELERDKNLLRADYKKLLKGAFNEIDNSENQYQFIAYANLRAITEYLYILDHNLREIRRKQELEIDLEIFSAKERWVDSKLESTSKISTVDGIKIRKKVDRSFEECFRNRDNVSKFIKALKQNKVISANEEWNTGNSLIGDLIIVLQELKNPDNNSKLLHDIGVSELGRILTLRFRYTGSKDSFFYRSNENYHFFKDVVIPPHIFYLVNN